MPPDNTRRTRTIVVDPNMWTTDTFTVASGGGGNIGTASARVTQNSTGPVMVETATSQLERARAALLRQEVNLSDNPFADAAMFDTSTGRMTTSNGLKVPPLDCAVLKKRHLTKEERQAYHMPRKDWELTGKGEVCKSTCSLVVDDLVE